MRKIEKLSKIILSICREGYLDDADLRPVLKLLIRHSTETVWPHCTANYRSLNAAQILGKIETDSPGRYQEACRTLLHHDHAVPAGEMLVLLRRMPCADLGSTVSVLQKFGLRATISTRDLEQLRIANCRNTMPASFWDSSSSLFMNPLARYIEAGIMADLVERSGDSWLPDDERSCR